MNRAWWTAHLIGVVSFQAALWLGYIGFYSARRPVVDGLIRAMTEPLAAMAFEPGTSLIVGLGVVTVIWGGAMSPPRWRNLATVAAYLMAAGYWLFARVLIEMWASC